MLVFLIFNVTWYLLTAMLRSAEIRIWMAVAWLGMAILWFIGLHVVSRRAGGEHDENI